ncbi:unnamed protein product [Rodentolepis nana]|uniref:E3 ubiquitin-protein transferase MAEA n=1 Tax=Rodentolepis nana TaxID=102285 RepID=A0A0R3TLC2_RODNA|nr:unnamed protein product [Rodentolepis nana]
MKKFDMCSDIELTEKVGMKAIFELFNKTYRVNHRELEKSASSLKQVIDRANGIKTSGDAVELLGNVLSAVKGLKRKADAIYSEELDFVSSCKKRIAHLVEVAELEEAAPKPRTQAEKFKPSKVIESFISEREGTIPSQTRTTNTIPPPHYDKPVFSSRFNRLLAEHLFAMGHYHSALALIKQVPDYDKIFVRIIEEAIFIQEALIRGETKPAHKWFNESNFRLKHSDLNFDFDMRIFEFYLLVRDDKRMEAVTHARQYLNNFKESDHYKPRRLGQAMVLLIMRTADEVKEKAKQNELNEEWIVKRFHLALMFFYSFISPTPFLLTVRAGMSAIKTPFCYHDESRNPNCVVCHPLINRYASNLVFGHHDQSILTCYQTGLIMDENNPPMALPNGYVYSQRVSLSLLFSLTNPTLME